MAPQFWYGRDCAHFGPFTATRMRELASTGTILPSDDVWQDGTERKFQASQVGNLFVKAATPATAIASPESAPPQPAVTETPPDRLPSLRRGVEPPPRKKRVIAIKGGILMGQDGAQAQYRKKCATCGWEDSCRSSAIIRIGMTRVSYFCRTCRKGRSVEMTAICN